MAVFKPTGTEGFKITGLRDIEGTYLDPLEIGLSKAISEELEEWVLSYQPIIPLSVEERHKKINKIRDLDEQGIEIVKRIKRELPDSKIEYYSEGLLKRTFFC